jgi:hypothetical protein
MKLTDLSMTHIEMRQFMKRIALLLVAVAMVAGVVAAGAQTSTRTEVKPAPESASQSAQEIRGASPYAEIGNEPPPKLFVDEPLPEGLAQGIVWIQWRVENVNVVPVFGKGALNISPRVGHLHIHVDDVGWWWADASGINTVDIAGLSDGPHKVRLELVNANHEPFPGQSRTVTFTIPKGASLSLSHSR